MERKATSSSDLAMLAALFRGAKLPPIFSGGTGRFLRELNDPDRIAAAAEKRARRCQRNLREAARQSAKYYRANLLYRLAHRNERNVHSTTKAG